MNSPDRSAHGITGSKPGVLGTIMEIFGVSRAGAIAGIVLAGTILGVATYIFVQSAPPGMITIMSGPEGSIFHTNAQRYAAVLARYGVKMNILTSQGSLENFERLCNPTLHVDVGFVQGGITNGAAEKLVSLGSISHQPLLVFYRGEPTGVLSAFSGKRVAVGRPGSGTRALALTLLEANGIKTNGPTTLLDWDPQRSSRAVQEGSIDAVFLMGEDASVAIMRELMRAPGIRLMSFDQAEAYTRRFSYLDAIKFPQGSIDFGSNLPPRDIHLLGPTVELIAREDLHPALSDLLLGAAKEVHGRATLLQRKGEFPAPLEHDIRLSADALRYYKSGKGFFYRFLPFWLASLTSRILVVVVPTIVLLIPALRSIPLFYRWRIRTRINPWYRALLALERELWEVKDETRRQELLRRLDEIERDVNRLRVPPSFADLFYDLRLHIAFVRQKAGGTKTPATG